MLELLSVLAICNFNTMSLTVGRLRTSPFRGINKLTLLLQVFQHQVLSDDVLFLKGPVDFLADGVLVNLAILVE